MQNSTKLNFTCKARQPNDQECSTNQDLRQRMCYCQRTVHASTSTNLSRSLSKPEDFALLLLPLVKLANVERTRIEVGVPAAHTWVEHLIRGELM